jgi:hypothetical protein
MSVASIQTTGFFWQSIQLRNNPRQTRFPQLSPFSEGFENGTGFEVHYQSR